MWISSTHKNIFNHARKKRPTSSTFFSGQKNAHLMEMEPCSQKIWRAEMGHYDQGQSLPSLYQCPETFSFLFRVMMKFKQSEVKHLWVSMESWGYEQLLSEQDAQPALCRNMVRKAWGCWSSRVRVVMQKNLDSVQIKWWGVIFLFSFFFYISFPFFFQF